TRCATATTTSKSTSASRSGRSRLSSRRRSSTCWPSTGDCSATTASLCSSRRRVCLHLEPDVPTLWTTRPCWCCRMPWWTAAFCNASPMPVSDWTCSPSRSSSSRRSLAVPIVTRSHKRKLIM
ncbi:MAG: hypothetical protein MHM6MM_007018, partial [Cercozoa sp. M6MM]